MSTTHNINHPAERLPMTHYLKIDPENWMPVSTATKSYEIRSIADRAFGVGDILCLREWDGVCFTGRTMFVQVTHVQRGGDHGIAADYVILTITHNVRPR